MELIDPTTIRSLRRNNCQKLITEWLQKYDPSYEDVLLHSSERPWQSCCVSNNRFYEVLRSLKTLGLSDDYSNTCNKRYEYALSMHDATITNNA